MDVAGLDAEVTKRDTMATVGLVYLETLRAMAAVDARKADVTLNKELLRLATERKSAGMATSLDVTRAKVQLENERQRLLVAAKFTRSINAEFNSSHRSSLLCEISTY